MFQLEITPRFSETDALGHISNVSYSVWFEHARTPIFKLFTPDLDPKKWCLILANAMIDFKAQAYLGSTITIDTRLSKIGTSSMIIEHRAYQSEKLIAVGQATMIHFDYASQKSQAIPENIKEQLKTFL
jgi:acyl-CoA thioester hydrolase